MLPFVRACDSDSAFTSKDEARCLLWRSDILESVAQPANSGSEAHWAPPPASKYGVTTRCVVTLRDSWWRVAAGVILCVFITHEVKCASVTSISSISPHLTRSHPNGSSVEKQGLFWSKITELWIYSKYWTAPIHWIQHLFTVTDGGHSTVKWMFYFYRIVSSEILNPHLKWLSGFTHLHLSAWSDV